MLRPKSVVGSRHMAAVMAPLAFVLSMSVSPQAFAACAPADSITTTVPNVTCGDTDDDLEVEDGGVVESDVSLGNGTNDAKIEGIVGHDILGGTGIDRIIIDGGSVGRGPDGPGAPGPNTGTINTGDDNDTITIED